MFHNSSYKLSPIVYQPLTPVDNCSVQSFMNMRSVCRTAITCCQNEIKDDACVLVYPSVKNTITVVQIIGVIQSMNRFKDLWIIKTGKKFRGTPFTSVFLFFVCCFFDGCIVVLSCFFIAFNASTSTHFNNLVFLSCLFM